MTTAESQLNFILKWLVIVVRRHALPRTEVSKRTGYVE